MCSMQARVQLQLNCNCAMVKRTFDSLIKSVLASGQAGMCIGSSVRSDERQMYVIFLMVKCFRSHAKCQHIAIKYVLLFFFRCQWFQTFCWETTLCTGLHFVLCAIKFIRKQLIERHSSIMIGTNLWRVLEFACRCESVWEFPLGRLMVQHAGAVGVNFDSMPCWWCGRPVPRSPMEMQIHGETNKPVD